MLFWFAEVAETWNKVSSAAIHKVENKFGLHKYEKQFGLHKSENEFELHKFEKIFIIFVVWFGRFAPFAK